MVNMTTLLKKQGNSELLIYRVNYFEYNLILLIHVNQENLCQRGEKVHGNYMVDAS